MIACSGAVTADIVIVGYPLLVANPSIADGHNPIVYYGLSGSEMTMIRTLAAQLDSVIAAAATQAGVANAAKQVEQAFERNGLRPRHRWLQREILRAAS